LPHADSFHNGVFRFGLKTETSPCSGQVSSSLGTNGLADMASFLLVSIRLCLPGSRLKRGVCWLTDAEGGGPGQRSGRRHGRMGSADAEPIAFPLTSRMPVTTLDVSRQGSGQSLNPSYESMASSLSGYAHRCRPILASCSARQGRGELLRKP